LQHTL